VKTAAGLFSGSEKTGCHEIAVRNPGIIDVEIAFPGTVSLDDGGDDKRAPRVDLASLETDGDKARLVFWEAKFRTSRAPGRPDKCGNEDAAEAACTS
jgi:hypothetical protein